ncbi:MAG TPA: thioesterase family protein [Solirubrobacteraceae bacterium]|nr:thioesterase family protein [Solirubrobacteraceae bacterium]
MDQQPAVDAAPTVYRYRLGSADVGYARQMFSADYYRWASRAWGTWQLDAGMPLRRMILELGIGLPTSETRGHHLAPIACGDEFTVELGVRDLSARGLVSDFEFVRVRDGKLAAHGYFVRRFVAMESMRPCASLPDVLERVFGAMAAQTRLRPYPERRAELQRDARVPAGPA